MSCLYVLEIKPLLVALFANIFSYSVGCLFVYDFLCCVKLINLIQFSSVAQSCPTLCDPMNSSTPGLPVHHQLPELCYPNSCPSSRWCHPAISSSVVPFSSCPQSLQASGSFPVSQLFSWGGQSIGVSASASVLPMNTQDWSPPGWTGWISLQSKGLSKSPLQHHNPICLFLLYFCCLGDWPKKPLIYVREALPVFSSGRFMVSCLIFKSLSQFKFFCVYGMRDCSNFIDFHVAVQFFWYHLLKRLSFLRCIFLPCHGVIDSGFAGLFLGSVLSHRPMCVGGSTALFWFL